jgi:catechol 2,3-dioxygenase-like lactoylglutathione lyase family enzyme
MRKGILLTAVILPLFAALAAFAQLAAPNESGISLGHLHMLSKDPEAQKKIWVEAFGAQLTKTGTLELLRLPGIFIIINNAEPSGGSVGSTVDHIAFSVKNTAAMKAKLADMSVPVNGPFATFPDNLRVELLEEKNQTSLLVMHHVHLTAPGMEVVKQWYVKTFGAVAGTRRDLPAAMFNGSELDFLPAQMPAVPTKGRTLDHIGFEVKNLEAFCKKLEAGGVKFDAPYREMPNLGLKIAFILDPIGTRIELTEGLAGK